MPKALGVLTTEVLENTGVASPETIEALKKGDMNYQVSDEEADKISESIGTEAKFEPTIIERNREKLTKAGEKHILDFLDKDHKVFEAVLAKDEKANTAYKALKNTNQRNAFLLNYFKDRSTGSDDSRAFQSKLEELQAKLETDYKPLKDYQDLEKEIEPAYQGRWRAEIVKNATRHKGIAQSLKDDARFERNILGDLDEIMQNKGLKIDTKTGKVLDSKGEPFIKGTQVLTYKDVVELVLEENKDYWMAKSDPPNPNKITVPVPPDPTKQADPVKEANRKRMQESA